MASESPTTAAEEPRLSDQDRAILEARALVKRLPVVLDTETSGLKSGDQVIEVAVVDLAGRPVFERLVKPSVPIHPEAYGVHGICEHLLDGAPDWLAVQQPLLRAIGQRPVAIYNASFDLARIADSAKATGCDRPEFDAVDLMDLVSTWVGEWSEYHHDYRWQSLESAARALRVRQKRQTHRAREDAEIERQVLDQVAEAVR